MLKRGQIKHESLSTAGSSEIQPEGNSNIKIGHDNDFLILYIIHSWNIFITNRPFI